MLIALHTTFRMFSASVHSKTSCSSSIVRFANPKDTLCFLICCLPCDVGWNMNADDAAAFAAAQQMQAAEAAREAQRQRAHDQPNLHQD